MNDRITRLEEQIALMQADLSQMSDELYAQQKENGSLRREIETLKGRIQSVQSDSGILKPEEDSPPPHY
jgi:SlyX protein